MKLDYEEFRKLDREDKEKEIKKAYYNNLDDILDTLYFHRALELFVFPDDEEEINNHIIEKSGELMDKYSGMDRGALVLKMMADLVSQGDSDALDALNKIIDGLGQE